MNAQEWQNLIGKQIQDPFGREEYVTITSVNPTKKQYTGVTKSGKTLTASTKKAIPVESSEKSLFDLKPPSSFSLNDFNPATSSIDDALQMRIQTPEQDMQLRKVTAEEATSKATKDIADITKADIEASNRAKLAISAAEFGVSILNTMNAYRQTTGVARFNIMQARNQAADALYRGRQAGFERQLEGVKAGESALLAMAAQGQSVTGAGVQKIQGSYEAIGIENAMREEVNAIREALGFELEELGYEYEIEMAGINRDMSLISSGLKFAANAYGSGAL